MATVGTLIISLQARTEAFDRGLARARANVQGTAATIRRSAGQITSALTAIPAALGGLAAAAGLSQIVRVITDFEQQLSDVRAVTQATEAQMKSLTAEARRLGATTQFSAAQAAEGMALLGQAGFSTEQILAAMGDTLNLAAAGNLELARSAEIVSNILSTFNLNATDARRVTDVLAAAAAISNTNVQQLGEAFSFAGPVAAGFGHSIEATAAALAVLSNRGIQASRAGEGLRRVLGVLADPTKEVRDTLAGLQRIFPELELSLANLNPQTNSTADIMARLAPLLQDTRVAFRLFGVEGAGVAAILARNVAQLQQYEARVHSSGQASEQAQIRVDNLRGDFSELTSAIEEVALQLGEQGLTGALRGAVQSLTAIIRESYSLRVALQAIGTVLDVIIRAVAALALGFEYSLSQTARIAVLYGTQIRAALADLLPGNLLGNAEELRRRLEELRQESDQAWIRYQQNLGNALGTTEQFNRAVREGQDLLAQDPFVAQQGLPPVRPDLPDIAGRKGALDDFLGGTGSGGALATVESVTKQVQELQANLAALDRQAAMGIPGFDLAAERVKLLDSGLREVTQTLSRQPELAAQLAPEMQKTVQALGPQLHGFQQVAEAQEQAREAAHEAAREAERRAQQVTQLVQQLGIEAQFLQQSLGLQKLNTGEQDARTRLLEFERQLQEQGLQLSAQQRQEAERHLATISATRQELEAIQARQAETQRRGDVQRRLLTDLAQEINLTTQLLGIQGLSDQQREIRTRLLTTEAELIANGVEVTDAYRQGLEQLFTTQVRTNAAIQRAAVFRDLDNEIQDLQRLVAAQSLSRRERERELLLVQERARLGRELGPEEEARLRRSLTQIQALNEELNRQRPLRDFAESTEQFWTNIEEGAVRALEGLEDAFATFATTGSLRSPEQIQTLQELNDLARERRALALEISQLEGLPGGQLPAEALRQQERLNQLQREVEVLDERKKVLDETVKSQNALNKLFNEFYDQLLKASVRTLFTGPLASAGSGATPGLAQSGAQGSQLTTLLNQGLNLVAGLFGGGTATAGQAASAIQGFRDAGFMQGIVAHTGGLIGRDAMPHVTLPTAAFAGAPGFQFGGIVGRGGDHVPAILQTGERVLSRSETTRLARLEAIAGQGRGQERQGEVLNLTVSFPGVTTKQEADAIRRSSSQIQNSIIQAVERSRARTNVPSPAR